MEAYAIINTAAIVETEKRIFPFGNARATVPNSFGRLIYIYIYIHVGVNCRKEFQVKNSQRVIAFRVRFVQSRKIAAVYRAKRNRFNTTNVFIHETRKSYRSKTIRRFKRVKRETCP